MLHGLVPAPTTRKGTLTTAEPPEPEWVNVSVLVGLGVTDAMTSWIDHTSATEFSVPAVPVLTVPAICKTGLLDTTLEIMTGVPVLIVVPVAFCTVTVVVVDAVIVKVPLFPVAPPVQPEVVTLAPTHAFDPAPDSVAARVYVHEIPPE